MQGSRYVNCWLPAVCFLIVANCAKHKLTPVGGPLPSRPNINVPVAGPQALPESKTAAPAKKATQAKGVGAEANRQLLEPPRMSFAPSAHAPGNDVPKIENMTILVDTSKGTLRPEAEARIQNALKVLANQIQFLCPDHMRVGTAEDCRFMTKEGFNDVFRDQLLALGVDASQAGAVTLLVHAELTTSDKNSFDIRALPENSPSPGGQLWRVVPRNSGDHKLDLKVTPSARIVSAGDVQGEPVVLVHSVSVIGVDNFLTEYGPAMVGCLAALGLLAWIAWTLWHNARPSAFNSR
jgi:hypothetical protein